MRWPSICWDVWEMFWQVSSFQRIGFQVTEKWLSVNLAYEPDEWNAKTFKLYFFTPKCEPKCKFKSKDNRPQLKTGTNTKFLKYSLSHFILVCHPYIPGLVFLYEISYCKYKHPNTNKHKYEFALCPHSLIGGVKWKILFRKYSK